MMALELALENIWLDKWRCDDAEKQFYEKQCKEDSEVITADKNIAVSERCLVTECIKTETGKNALGKKETAAGLGGLANKIAKARMEIQNSLACDKSESELVSATKSLSTTDTNVNLPPDYEAINARLFNSISVIEKAVEAINSRISTLEAIVKSQIVSAPEATTETKAAIHPPTPSKVEDEEEEDEDVDLFGSDEEEDAEAARVREERLQAYAEKKSKKPGPIAKSSVLLDCKPWDDETDMKVMEKKVREITMDGLTWGAAKLQPLAYGIMKLSILCVVEDEKVSIDDLSEKITEIEDYVQSVDIAAFNKI